MFLGSLVEYATCVNTVDNATVHYDYWKHIQFNIILLLPFIIKIILIRSAVFFYPHLGSYIFQIYQGRRESYLSTVH
jgi:hypothetical protein